MEERKTDLHIHNFISNENFKKSGIHKLQTNAQTRFIN